MQLALAVGVLVGATLSAALTRGVGRALAVVVALLCGFVVPPEHTFLRFVFAVQGFVVLMRALDLWADPRDWSWRFRVWLLSTAVDVRDAVPVARRLGGILPIAGYAILAASGWWLSQVGSDLPPLRWLGGAIMIYGIADAACGLAVVAFAAAGYEIPLQHRSPILACSVGEFWSKHYNCNVSAWLSRHFHRPLARQGHPRLGLLAAFGFSAAIHFWVAFVPLGLRMAALMGVFFVVQGALIVLERALQIHAWPVALRRAWTIAWLLVTSPLFVEPFLRLFGD
jgi:hypothetical protein